MSDPETNSVRALSSRHNISIQRLDAILRLKGLEEAWKKASFDFRYIICTPTSNDEQYKSISL